MRNKITHRQLGRNTAHRLALFRNMVESLVTHERIRTTLAKAKELRRHADKVVTWAKVGGSTYESKLAGFLRTSESVDKVKTVLKPRYRCVLCFFSALGVFLVGVWEGDPLTFHSQHTQFTPHTHTHLPA